MGYPHLDAGLGSVDALSSSFENFRGVRERFSSIVLGKALSTVIPLTHMFYCIKISSHPLEWDVGCSYMIALLQSPLGISP